jgi:hypothetical protein
MYRFVLFQLLVGIWAIIEKTQPLFGDWHALSPLMVLVIGILSSHKPERPNNALMEVRALECRYCGKEMPTNLVQCRECGSFGLKDYACSVTKARKVNTKKAVQQ